VSSAAGLRTLAAWAAPASAPPVRETATCELCPIGLGTNHRHLLDLEQRRIICVCETCWSLRSGDPEFRPSGQRVLWLDDFRLPDELWAAFEIPIGLAFFMRSGMTGGIVAQYPSMVGAMESELDMAAWDRLEALNPYLERLETDAEALLVNRLVDPAQYVIAPIDRCYMLVGLIKVNWEGISGGGALKGVVADFFDGLRAQAMHP
jgi:uncharacterized protein DUF5947